MMSQHQSSGMPSRVQARLLPDRRRLHLHDGPIDLIIEAFGPPDAVACAYTAATRRMSGLLDELCAELPALRRQALATGSPLTGAVARRMYRAVRPHAARGFITPMAAVAGSVASEILGAMRAACGDTLDKAYVNNGGDIALHLRQGQSFTAGLAACPDRFDRLTPDVRGTATIHADDGVEGIATSGAPGRSFSLGIADAVTILARDAAGADAAATVIANAVDLPDHQGIVRVPAEDLQPGSDLGRRLVTRHVPMLSGREISDALEAGMGVALDLHDEGLIFGAALHLQGFTRVTGRHFAPADSHFINHHQPRISHSKGIRHG